MPNITNSLIENTPRPERAKQLILRDDLLPGFAVRLTPTSAAFIVEKRVNDRVRRIMIGKHGKLTTVAAREQARKLLAEMAAGNDPRPPRAPTLNLVLEHYLANKRLRPSTVKSYRQVVRLHLWDWADLPVTDITNEMVLARHRDLVGRLRPTTANLVMTVLRALLYHAAETFKTIDGQPVLTTNLVSKLSRTRAWYRAHRRQGVIPQHKLAGWYAAMISVCTRNIQQYLMILTLTGLRRNELATLRWADVDLDARTLTVRAELAKNHREHVLPLSEFLLLLFKQRKAESAGSEFVFPGRYEGHMVSSARSI
jgi:integrase